MPRRLMSAAVAVALLAGGIVLGSLTTASSQGRETTRIRVFNPDRRPSNRTSVSHRGARTSVTTSSATDRF